MKLFKIEFQRHNGQILDAGMVPSDDGAWYHHSNVEKLIEENTRLKDLNRELVETIKKERQKHNQSRIMIGIYMSEVEVSRKKMIKGLHEQMGG